MKSKEDSIKFWKAQYGYIKSIVDRIDKGENMPPNSVMGMVLGQRQHCVDEANIAVDRLAKLGVFDLQKIK